MKISFTKTTAIGFTVVISLLFSACGKKTDDSSVSGEVTIPDSPDAAVQTIISEFASGNSDIAWRALPTSYQSDINELVHLFGSSADEEVYNKSFSLFARLAEVIDQQKSFIVNSSFMQGQSPEAAANLEAALPSVTGLINTITSSELSSIGGLLNFDGKAFFETTVPKCIEHLEVIGQLGGDETKLSDYASTVVSVVDSDGQQARLLITVPGQEAEEMVFTKVENRWVPLEMEREWETNIKEMIDSIKAMPAEDFEAQKTQIMGAFTMCDGILTKIASAQTQEQFDQSLQESAMPLMSIFMMLNQASGSSN